MNLVSIIIKALLSRLAREAERATGAGRLWECIKLIQSLYELEF